MSNLICEVKQLNLVYNVRAHLAQNARDVFISALSNPLDLLSKQADRKHVLRDISFQISKGDRIALLGVNGAGKTSLCRILSGVMQPTRGRLTLPQQARAIFQTSLSLYPELTGRENVQCLIELLYPLDSKEIHRKMLEDVIQFSELAGEVDLPFRTYSAGMQARLMLSLATARPVELLILDEVFDGADIFWREKFGVRMTRFIEESGSMLFVSHYPDVLKKVCNKSMMLNGGQLSVYDSVEEGLKNYELVNSGSRK